MAIASGSAVLGTEDDPAQWNAAVGTITGGTAFHGWDFLDLQEALLGIRIERLTVSVDGARVGVLPVARRSNRGLRAPHLPFPLLGPVVPPDHLAATLAALARWQRTAGLLLARIDVAPALTAAAGTAVRSSGFVVTTDSTVVLDIGHGSVAALDAGMHRSRRQGIRRGMAHGASAAKAAHGQVASVLSAALSDAYEARGVPNPYPPDAGERIEAWAAGRSDVYLAAALVEDRLVGANVLLTGHSVAEGWLGACLAEARASRANEVLLRQTLIGAIECGNRFVDFAGRVNDRLEEFKLSFGGRAVDYLVLERFLGPDFVRRALQTRPRGKGPV